MHDHREVGGKRLPSFIDPEELPFTRDEIYEAARTFLPEATAGSMADHLAIIGPQLVEARTERRAQWERGGIANATRLPLYAWDYPDELLPALAVLSPEVEQRVVALRRFLSRVDLPGTA
jgi:hypothetical protein